MALNNNASGGSKQHNIGVQLSFFKKSINIFSAVPNAFGAIAALLGGSSINDNIDLWICAYKLVQRREAKLMENYMKHLDTLYVNGPPVPERDLLSPLYVESVVSQLIKIREKNKIHVSLPRANTEMREQIENLAKLLLWSDMIVKTTFKSHPHAALAWSGVSIFLSLLADIPVYNKAMLEGFNTLSDMQIFWKACEETYLTSSKSQLYYNLRDPLAELYSFIIEYQARIICHITRSPVSRSLKCVTGSDDWTEMIQPIKNLEQNCLSHITGGQRAEIYLNSKSQLQAIQKQVILQEEILQDLKNNKQDDIERNLLGDLARVSGDYARYKNINPDRVRGTCEWFLADSRFCKWRDSQIGALLWVSAGPGCGKSVLSRCLIDEGHLIPDSTITIESSVIRASQRPSVICYFFFKEGDEGRMDGAHALCAILHQLFQHPLTSNLITCALLSHRSHQETLTQKMEVLWQILVDCAKSSPADIVCVLDALDECRGDSAQQLLGIIEKSYSQQDGLLRPSILKFLITSRPYDDLRWSFDRLTSIATYLHFDGDEKSGQIGKEINLVIDVRVKHIAGGLSENDCNKISKHLKSMENRTYLWLHLTLNIIEKKRGAYSRFADIEELLRELPSNAADAYEKILSRSQDDRKVEALLQIVLAATRPLTLDEANNALALVVEEGGFSAYATLKEKLWPQDTFKTTVQNLCGLFISIHDSKLSFIHLTAREFLVSHEQTGAWKGRLSLSKSHGILSEACINYLQILDPSCKSLYDEYPFSFYAAHNWFSHFRSQDTASTEMLRKPARELCRTSSPQGRVWYKQDYRLRTDAENGTDLHFAGGLGLAAVVYDVIVHEHADMNAKRRRYGETVLGLAIRNGDLEVMEVLLDLGAKSGEDEVGKAAGHGSKAEVMMALLLDKRGSEIKITEDVLKSAVRNRQCGAAVLAWLFKRRGDEIKITEAVVKWAACYGLVETMSLLLDERGNEFEITEEVMKFTTLNERDMLALLLDRRGHEVKITEAVLMEAMENQYSETLDLLLDNSNEIKITKEMVQNAASNFHGLEIIQLLFEKRGHEITVTEGIVKAAASNVDHAPEIMALLLDMGANEIKTTEDIVKAAVSNTYFGLGITALLLDKSMNTIAITEDIVKAAMANMIYGLEITALLLDRRGNEIAITEDIVKAAVANIYNGLEITTLLLDRRGNEIAITEDIVKAAVANTNYAKSVMSLLLDRRGNEIAITEDIIKAAVANTYNGLEIMALLLDRCGNEIAITEDIFKAAVGNRQCGMKLVTLLLDRRGQEINITEDVITAAQIRPDNKAEMLALLQQRRGNLASIIGPQQYTRLIEV